MAFPHSSLPCLVRARGVFVIRYNVTELPKHVRPYRQTPRFTAGTIPAALLRDHATKAGVWGLLHVHCGTVAYRIADSGATQDVSIGQTAVIVPEQRHSVSLSPDAIFHVEFWR